MQGLTPGRIVHFVLDSGAHRPAMITEVVDENSGLSEMTVFLSRRDLNVPEGVLFNPTAVPAASVQFSPSKEAGTWHWIERVDPEPAQQEIIGDTSSDR